MLWKIQERNRNIFRGGGTKSLFKLFPGRNFHFVDPSKKKKFSCFLKVTNKIMAVLFSLFSPCIFHFPHSLFQFSVPLFSKLVSKNFPVTSLCGGTPPCLLYHYATGKIKSWGYYKLYLILLIYLLLLVLPI